MMEAIAKHRYARTSAQKARLVADQVRGLSVDKALNILTFSPKKAAALVKKVLESAIANAEHNEGADIDALPITEETGAEHASLHPGLMHACGPVHPARGGMAAQGLSNRTVCSQPGEQRCA